MLASSSSSHFFAFDDVGTMCFILRASEDIPADTPIMAYQGTLYEVFDLFAIH
jgi:hypothetical protein